MEEWIENTPRVGGWISEISLNFSQRGIRRFDPYWRPFGKNGGFNDNLVEVTELGRVMSSAWNRRIVHGDLTGSLSVRPNPLRLNSLSFSAPFRMKSGSFLRVIVPSL